MFRTYLAKAAFIFFFISSLAFAHSHDDFAPNKVVGKTFYGVVDGTAKPNHDTNVMLKFRAPFGKHNRMKFYPISGPQRFKIKNSGYYEYMKLGPKQAEMNYSNKTGLQKTLKFDFKLTFDQKNKGRFMANVFMVVGDNAQLVYITTQHGTFEIK